MCLFQIFALQCHTIFYHFFPISCLCELTEFYIKTSKIEGQNALQKRKNFKAGKEECEKMKTFFLIL